jgi:exodeoxyribonuclease V alpha subunit
VADRNSIVRAPLRGEVWQLTGRFSKHPKYGEQLHVERSKLFQPTGRLLIRYLAVHPSFRGIGVGQAKASRLYEEFGDQLAEILDRGETSRVATVLGDEVAGKLVSTWKESAQQSAVVAFLDRHGVDPRLAGKILRYWPEGAIEKLRENPYRLLVLAPWHTVDRIATSIGVDRYDERRLISAAEASVYERLDTAKDTLVKEADLRSAVNRLLCPGGDDVSRRAIELAVADGTIVGNAGDGYQPYGCVVMERYLMNRFTAMLRSDQKTQVPLFGGEVSGEVIDSSIRAFESEEAMRLSDEQRSAVRMACTEPLGVLTGGAGVGKTTVLKAIHRAVESSGGAVLQMALAGRAAQRMREATGRDEYTITGFLNQVRTGKIKLGSRHLVIVDESTSEGILLDN